MQHQIPKQLYYIGQPVRKSKTKLLNVPKKILTINSSNKFEEDVHLKTKPVR